MGRRNSFVAWCKALKGILYGKHKVACVGEIDWEQFIKDNQEAFNYGSLEEFGRRNDQFRDGMFRFEKRMK